MLELREPIALIHPMSVWYGQDLVRNDPFLPQHTKVFFAVTMPPHVLQYLNAIGPMRFITQEDLVRHGHFPTQRRPPAKR